MELIPLVVVVGPTASGKTRLAVDIALKYNGEVVSADSMQIYRGFNIGTAKPTPEEMRGIPHHMIDVIDPWTCFSVADYVAMAKKCIENIHGRGRLPVVAGGTGLYVRSLVRNIHFGETVRNESLRAQLEKTAEQEDGPAQLHEMLSGLDPELARKLHPNNTGRIIRAIEVCKTTGMTMTRMQELSRQSPPAYRACWIGLEYSEREMLYDRINRRVDEMVAAGLPDEVRQLLKNPGLQSATSMQAIGYKEFTGYFNGEISLEQAVENIKRETRRYAKRQLTWFRREPDVSWIDVGTNKYENICKTAFQIIEKCGLL